MSSSSNPSSVSGNSRRRFGDRGRGIPKTCRCGEGSVMRTSGTTDNPGRLFHCCPLGSKGDKFHLFKWTDECVVDEIEDINAMISEVNGDISELKAVVLGFEKEIEGMKKVIVEFERERKEWISEMRCLKKVMVCGFGLAALCYYFFA